MLCVIYLLNSLFFFCFSFLFFFFFFILQLGARTKTFINLAPRHPRYHTVSFYVTILFFSFHKPSKDVKFSSKII